MFDRMSSVSFWQCMQSGLKKSNTVGPEYNPLSDFRMLMLSNPWMLKDGRVVVFGFENLHPKTINVDRYNSNRLRIIIKFRRF